MFDSQDDIQHKNFYRQSIQKYGVKDVRSLHWNSIKTQEIRFKSLLNMGDMNNQSLLDLGAGTGGFYGFLLKNKILPSHYIGVDFLKEFVDTAISKYPRADWICSDFFKLPEQYVDFIVCNGALNVKREDNMSFLQLFLERFVPQAKKALGITLLKYASGYIENPMIYTYDISTVQILLNNMGLKYCIYKDYIDNDFTIIINKD